MGCLSILYGNNFKYSTEILFPLAVIPGLEIKNNVWSKICD